MVKKQAAINYFEKTADSKDDSRFKFDFKTGTKAPDYSFNWPYDYCSLVELAQIESEIQIAAIPKPVATNLANSIPSLNSQFVGVQIGSIPGQSGQQTATQQSDGKRPIKLIKNSTGAKRNGIK